MRNGIYREEHGEKLLHYRRRAGGEGTKKLELVANQFSNPHKCGRKEWS